MARKDALRLNLTDKFASAGLATLLSKPVEVGQIWCLEQIAWEIDTALSGGNTRGRLYIGGHGYKHDLAEQDAPVINRLYTYSRKPYLHYGERLALDLDQAQADTIAKLKATGYIEFTKEG